MGIFPCMSCTKQILYLMIFLSDIHLYMYIDFQHCNNYLVWYDGDIHYFILQYNGNQSLLFIKCFFSFMLKWQSIIAVCPELKDIICEINTLL